MTFIEISAVYFRLDANSWERACASSSFGSAEYARPSHLWLRASPEAHTYGLAAVVREVGLLS